MKMLIRYNKACFSQQKAFIRLSMKITNDTAGNNDMRVKFETSLTSILQTWTVSVYNENW